VSSPEDGCNAAETCSHKLFNVLSLTIVYFIIVVPDVNYIHLYLSHNGMASEKKKLILTKQILIPSKSVHRKLCSI